MPASHSVVSGFKTWLHSWLQLPNSGRELVSAQVLGPSHSAGDLDAVSNSPVAGICRMNQQSGALFLSVSVPLPLKQINNKNSLKNKTRRKEKSKTSRKKVSACEEFNIYVKL